MWMHIYCRNCKWFSPKESECHALPQRVKIGDPLVYCCGLHSSESWSPSLAMKFADDMVHSDEDQAFVTTLTYNIDASDKPKRESDKDRQESCPSATGGPMNAKESDE